MTPIIQDVCTGKGTLDRNAVITLALLYFVRDDYPDEEEPYVRIAKDLLRTEFGLPPRRVAELNRMGGWGRMPLRRWSGGKHAAYARF